MCIYLSIYSRLDAHVFFYPRLCSPIPSPTPDPDPHSPLVLPNPSRKALRTPPQIKPSSIHPPALLFGCLSNRSSFSWCCRCSQTIGGGDHRNHPSSRVQGEGALKQAKHNGRTKIKVRLLFSHLRFVTPHSQF
jgi:hypothetical protein